MNALELDRDVIDKPVINPWRHQPSRGQIAYATDLCRSELPYAERVRILASFEVLDSSAMAALIDELRAARAKRMARLRRSRRRPR